MIGVPAPFQPAPCRLALQGDVIGGFLAGRVYPIPPRDPLPQSCKASRHIQRKNMDTEGKPSRMKLIKEAITSNHKSEAVSYMALGISVIALICVLVVVSKNAR